MKTRITILILLSLSLIIRAQDYRQTVRGQIIDKDSHNPVAFAAILLNHPEYHANAITNEMGQFILEGVPVGRVSLRVICLGYQETLLANLEVTMGRELVLNLELIESVMKLEEVSVKAFNSKEKPINSFAPVSARSFSIEESQRYAGSNNDVSRMAMNFAGVSQLTETSNEIIIRGNSPVGVLFRLEGIDIPNPSHFGDGGTTGGPVGMLNNNVLANSDFLTGAFPAEYGNAISGVFDLRMRNGNNEKHQFLAQAGLMGFELGAEGPILKKGHSSYLVNYRYSTLTILRALGMKVMGEAITDYQDLSFKLNLPSKKLGNLTLFGIGGISYMSLFDSKRDTTEEKQQLAYESDYEMDIVYENYTGSLGLSHSYIFGSTAYTRLILSATTIWNYYSLDSLSSENRLPVRQYFSDFGRTKYAAKFYINKKFNSRHTLRMGAATEIQQFSMLDSLFIPVNNAYRTLRDFSGIGNLSQSFVQYRYRNSDRLQFCLGLHAVVKSPRAKLNLEPRAGLSWEFTDGHQLNLGYGLHSLSTPVEIVNQKVLLPDGSYRLPNLDLGFIKSHHFVLAYDTRLMNRYRFKSELYYQYITDVPIEQESGTYSFLNRGAYTVVDADALVNGGKGYNYGLELTAEKFMDHGSYFLATCSLFESKYRGSDGILRNTAFNTNFVVNLLGGKEFKLGARNENAHFIKKIVVDGKINWSGGQRYSPIDLEASKAAGTTVFDQSNAYSLQLKDYFRLDLRLAYKWIGKGSSQEIAIDIRNLTNRENPFQIRFDPETGDIITRGFGLTPDLLYRISF